MSQTSKILKHLKSGRRLSALDALRFYGCLRLSARIWDLREAGYYINSEIIRMGGKNITFYYMENGHERY